MLLGAAITVVLLVACTFIHYETLSQCNALLPRVGFLPPRAKVLAAVAAALLSHLLQVTIFAAAYYFLHNEASSGRLAGEFENTFSSYLYFSLQTYTTLGFGDVFPQGSLRLLAGMEGLTGLLMISWTASFTYLEMARYWAADSST